MQVSSARERTRRLEAHVPLLILTGLPGSGKSQRLIEHVKQAISDGKPTVTFACSDSISLASRDSVRVHRLLTCRRPGLTCPLDRFVSSVEAEKIVEQTPSGGLIAFDEAHFFGPHIVRSWVEAARRGVDVIVATPSVQQLDLLESHGYAATKLLMSCERCGRSEATTFIALPGEDTTISICADCHSLMVDTARREILDRLLQQPPHPGERAIYQPVELEECAEWRILRPDSKARVDLVGRVIREFRLTDQTQGSWPTYLDIGCNTGYFCHQVRRLGFAAQGVDVVEGDIAVARLLDSFFRRDHNVYRIADAYDFLRDTEGTQVDVISAFSVFQWVMMQKSVETGFECLKLMFAKVRKLCFLEMGDTSEEHYRGRLGIEIDRAWVQAMMKREGRFAEVRVLDARENSLKRDVLVGIKG